MALPRFTGSPKKPGKSGDDCMVVDGSTTEWEKMNNVPIPQQPLLLALVGELGIGACIGIKLGNMIKPSHYLSGKIKDQL